MSTYKQALSLQHALSQTPSDPFKFYKHLKYIHKSIQNLSLDFYRSYFYRTKLLGSNESPIYAVANLDLYLIEVYLQVYIDTLRSTKKTYKEHLKRLEDKHLEQLTYIASDVAQILSTYTCPDRARLCVNADSSYTYYAFKNHSHIFYKATGTHIYYGELSPDKGLSASKNTRGGSYLHKDIANLVWPEDNL